MTILTPLALLAATITTGLTAGAFALYAHTIMPGLRTTDDRTFVAAFTALDRAIVNPWFMASGFAGALVCIALATAASLDHGPLQWVVAALASYLVAVLVTLAVHVPLNDAIKRAGAAGEIADLAAVRERFRFGWWVRWNRVRVVTSAGAFVCLAWALLAYGRATG